MPARNGAGLLVIDKEGAQLEHIGSDNHDVALRPSWYEVRRQEEKADVRYVVCD